jgi:protein TonB
MYEPYDVPEVTMNQEVKVKVEVIQPEIRITSIKPTVGTATNPIYDNIVIVANDAKIKESVIESSEVGEKDAIQVEGVYFKDIEEVTIEEEVIEDVPFVVIEKVPIYPGCEGSNAALRKCLEKSVRDYIAENFNVDLAQDLGLEPGKRRIFVLFVIDKTGGISNIQTRAPHKRLELEAERVVKSLPKMKPGEQRGKAVGVKYSLPIVFEVH